MADEDGQEAGSAGPGETAGALPRARGGPLPLLAAEVRAFVHSTEDAERVRACVRAVVGEGAEVREMRGHGYHHQPLRVLEAEVRDRPGLRRILGLLRTDEMRADYGLTWERRLDAEHGTVHFRLAKQPLLAGLIRIEPPDGKGDLVKLELRLQAFPAKAERYRELARTLLD
jgi:RNA binding exosome subunit